MARGDTSTSKTLYQLFDLLLVFMGILASILVVHLFRKSTDKFIYASAAFMIMYGIGMLFVSNRNEFQQCLGNDQLTYKIVRYTTMAVIFLATMVILAVYMIDGEKKPSAPPAVAAPPNMGMGGPPQGMGMGMGGPPRPQMGAPQMGPQQGPRPPQGVPGGPPQQGPPRPAYNPQGQGRPNFGR